MVKSTGQKIKEAIKSKNVKSRTVLRNTAKKNIKELKEQLKQLEVRKKRLNLFLRSSQDFLKQSK